VNTSSSCNKLDRTERDAACGTDGIDSETPTEVAIHVQQREPLAVRGRQWPRSVPEVGLGQRKGRHDRHALWQWLRVPSSLDASSDQRTQRQTLLGDERLRVGERRLELGLKLRAAFGVGLGIVQPEGEAEHRGRFRLWCRLLTWRRLRLQRSRRSEYVEHDALQARARA